MKVWKGLAGILIGASFLLDQTPAGPQTGPGAAPPGRYDIERYLNIRVAACAGLLADAKTMGFTTNLTGTRQVWTIPSGGGWPEQITFFEDAVSRVEWSPRGDWIAFSKDKGGDENHQLYLVSPDGKDLVALTSSPQVRHNFGAWSKDGRFIAYASNERNSRFFDIYVMDVDSRQARRVVEGDALWGAGPFSRDGKRLIAIRSNASLDNDLFLVDLARGWSGEPPDSAHLTPHQGKADHQVIDWSVDNTSLWIASDSGREFYGLGRLILEARKVVWVREPKWDVTNATLSRDGRQLALVVNEDGYDTLHLLDTVTRKDRPLPEIPGKQLDDMVFSRDGKRLALTVSGPARNADVWLIDLAGGSARQVTRSSTAGIPRASFVEPRLVRYRSFDGLEIPAFLYTPAGSRQGEGLPGIVMPHGGPEGQTTARFSPTIQYYLNRGYAIWAPNVRGSTGYGKTFTHLDDVRKREDSVKDLAAGVAWLKSSGWIDPKKIAVMGGSYGGYMTLAAITLYPDLWAAAVDSFGIANFKTFLARTASYRAGLRASEYGDPLADGDFLDSISPLHKADRIRAPLLVLQGANDPRVPQEEAEQIVAAVRQAGGVAEYILFPDEGHGWAKLANQITAHRASADFLDRHLRGTTAARP